jgi:hypothetical protein
MALLSRLRPSPVDRDDGPNYCCLPVCPREATLKRPALSSLVLVVSLVLVGCGGRSRIDTPSAEDLPVSPVAANAVQESPALPTEPTETSIDTGESPRPNGGSAAEASDSSRRQVEDLPDAGRDVSRYSSPDGRVVVEFANEWAGTQVVILGSDGEVIARLDGSDSALFPHWPVYLAQDAWSSDNRYFWLRVLPDGSDDITGYCRVDTSSGSVEVFDLPEFPGVTVLNPDTGVVIHSNYSMSPYYRDRLDRTRFIHELHVRNVITGDYRVLDHNAGEGFDITSEDRVSVRWNRMDVHGDDLVSQDPHELRLDATATAQPDHVPTGRVHADHASVFASESPDSEVIAELANGTEFTLLGQTEREYSLAFLDTVVMYMIETETDVVGWVSADTVDLLPWSEAP